MPGHNFKTPGLLRAGFQYQDLVAVETLIDFYRQRNRYVWVQLDAEDSGFRSIEDVVACTPDGRYELTQVKFTADPSNSSNSLSWAWLTTKLGTRRSLLQKWAKPTLRHKEAGTLAQAVLKTNRIPDAAFARCLKGEKVNYTLLPRAIKAVVDKQLGSRKAAESFFDAFKFIHSQPELDDLEEILWKKIASDTDRGGWARFWQQVQRWSTRKNQPAPCGKIKYVHLRQAFSVERSKPLPQDFLVPNQYVIPDENFDKMFFKETLESDGLTVLWAPPGCGKSTYLSHYAARIDHNQAVCIRHHYFLSLTDRSEGRFHYHAIARSLKHQLHSVIPDLAANKSLGESIEEAGNKLQQQARRLIVIVDGLDHVWRDHRDREDMEALFDALLPLPSNVRLIVGTQKIANENLPAKLLSALPTEHWTELPLMSQEAVHRWLRLHDEAGRLNLEITGQQTRKQVVRVVARAFHDISQGLPLHLIYSFEAVVRTGNVMTKEDISALPACPTGDIRDYYRSFWQRMGVKSRTILHVLAGMKFGPPPFAREDCFGRNRASLAAWEEIDHLLEYRETEIRPFHGSLFAYVRELAEHKNTFHTHAPDILDWIETRAPEYWRWAWLWITKAQLGNASDLLAGPSREWAIESLVAGYSIEQLIVILDHAEKIAFDAFDLPRLLNFRSLKTRALNASEYQTGQWPLFLEMLVSLSGDPNIGALLREELHRAPADTLPFIVRNADESIRADLIQTAIAELNRWVAHSRNDRVTGIDQQSELDHAIAAVVANAKLDMAESFVAFAERAEDPEALIATYARAAVLVSNYDNVFVVGEQWSHHDLDRDVLAALCFEGLAPTEKPKLKALAHPAICCLAFLKSKNSKQPRTRRDLSHLFVEGGGSDATFVADMRHTVYDIFFVALFAELSGCKSSEWSNIPGDARTTWLSEAMRALERLAEDIAERWKAARQWPTLQNIYGTFELECPIPHSYIAQRRLTAFRLALQDIAVDLCTIAKGLTPNALISVNDIESVPTSPFWLDDSWLETFSERRLPLHTPEAAQTLVERMRRRLDTEITQFDERAVASVKLVVFASDHGLVPLARKELRRSVGCLLGYGYRKDTFAFEVLESLNLLVKRGDAAARKTMLDLAGDFEALTEYTDGKETHNARKEYYAAIAMHFPERISACYEHLIRKEEWSYAEGLAIAFAETDQVESRAGRALLETYIAPSEIRVLKKNDSKSRTHTNAALESVRRKTGRIIESALGTTVTEPPNSVDDDLESGDIEISFPEPSEFHPGRLQEYLNAIRDVSDYSDRQKLVVQWLRHWDAVGCADEALNDFEAAISKTRPDSDLGEAMDTAFEIVLRTRGRSKAFPWLTRAHVVRAGWHRWLVSSDEEAQARMQVVTQHYPDKWREFIKNTAKSTFATGAEQDGISIGLSRFVCFLIEVGEMDMARSYALEMSRVFKAELEEQPIEMPEWAK